MSNTSRRSSLEEVTQGKRTKNGGNLALSKLHFAKSMLISPKPLNGLSQPFRGRMLRFKPKELFPPRDIQTTTGLTIG